AAVLSFEHLQPVGRGFVERFRGQSGRSSSPAPFGGSKSRSRCCRATSTRGWSNTTGSAPTRGTGTSVDAPTRRSFEISNAPRKKLESTGHLLHCAYSL